MSVRYVGREYLLDVVAVAGVAQASLPLLDGHGLYRLDRAMWQRTAGAGAATYQPALYAQGSVPGTAEFEVFLNAAAVAAGLTVYVRPDVGGRVFRSGVDTGGLPAIVVDWKPNAGADTWRTRLVIVRIG